MKSIRLALLVCLLAAMAFAQDAQACSTFQIQKQGQVYFGRNYDWMVGDALIIINKRGTKKPPYVRPTDKGRPMEWTAKYGSLTFNQYGRELPTGGMNETGLVVELMSLRSTQYPPPDQRPYIASTLYWQQYMLDNFATVDQVLAATKKVRISPAPSTTGPHYLISDAKGDCAVVEFLKGKLVVYQDKDLPVRALTNSTYEKSLKSISDSAFLEFDTWQSLSRFRTAATMLSAYGRGSKGPPLDYAYKVLKGVSMDNTQWSIVYDQNNLKAHIRTKNNPKPRTVDLKKFDLSCNSPVMMLDIDAGPQGDVTADFKPYTLAANRDLLKRSFGNTPFLKDIPQKALERAAAFPEGCKCVAP